MVDKRFARGLVVLLILTFLWGTTFPFIKIIVTIIGYSYYVFLRFSLAAAILTPIMFFLKNLREGLRETIKPGFILGMLFLGGITLQGLGMEYTTASNAAFITGLNSVIVYSLEVLIGRERFSVKLSLAVSMAVLGMYLLSITNGLIFNLGDIIVFFGSVFWALQIIAVGTYTRKYSLLHLTYYEILFTALGAIPLVFLSKPITIVKAGFVFPELLYLAVACTIITNTLQLYGQKHVSNIQAAIIYLFEPVFAAILSYIILGEVFTERQLAGAVLILVAIFLSSARNVKYNPIKHILNH